MSQKKLCWNEMRYIIFAKDSCPFCIKTLELLEQQELPHSVINFEPDQEVILGEIKEAYDWRYKIYWWLYRFRKVVAKCLKRRL